MMAGAFPTATVSAISLVVMVIDLSSGIRVASELGQFWSRNRQSLLPRRLDQSRFRGVSGKEDNYQFLHEPTFSDEGLNGELKYTRFPTRSSRDTTSARVSSEAMKKDAHQLGIFVYRPSTETGHVHLPESQTTLIKNKHNWSSKRESPTSRKSKRDIAWIYHRQIAGANNKNPEKIDDHFRLLNGPRELADTVVNKAADGAVYDAAVRPTSSDGEAWKEIGNLVAAARKSGYGVSLEVEPYEVTFETDHEKPKKSKQKLEGRVDSDAKGTRSGNEDDDEDDTEKSENNAMIMNSNPIRVLGNRKWETDPVRVWGKRASKTSRASDKRSWDTDTVRVWGKRAWEIDPVRVWGKRAWEMDPVRVWGKRAWEMDPVRVWGKRAWEMDPVRVWGKRAWEMDPVRVWGKRAWEMDPVRVWGKRAWEMDPVRVWGKRAWEMDPVRVWGNEIEQSQ